MELDTIAFIFKCLAVGTILVIVIIGMIKDKKEETLKTN